MSAPQGNWQGLEIFLVSQPREGELPASSGRAGMLLNIQQGTGQAPWQNYLTLSVIGVEVEKLCSGKMGLHFHLLLSTALFKESGSELPPIVSWVTGESA